MLYAIGFKDEDFNKPIIGIASTGYEGNPCNMHLNKLALDVKKGVQEMDYVGLIFNTIGVSDGISMGTPGMRYSLPSRDIIADSVETVVEAMSYDGLITVVGCDKNMPGALMGMIRLNRPSILLYGGTIDSGCHNDKKLDIVSAFEAWGGKVSGKINEIEYKQIIKKSCPGSGACGGMYTANTMASAIEALGMSLPFSSSIPANDLNRESLSKEVGKSIEKLIVRDIKPLDIMTRESFLNAVKFLSLIGGSTNGVIHLLAIAKTAGVKLTLDDFKEYEHLPVLTNMKPHGTNVMNDLNQIGGTSTLIKYMIEYGILDGNCLTVTGKTLRENTLNYRTVNLASGVIMPYERPFKKSSHINILSGNMAPSGSVSKIYSENKTFSGKAIVFNTEEEMLTALEDGKITKDNFVILRYQGESIGCPEMLTPTSALVGYFNAHGLSNEIPPFATDGRFSGGSSGVLVAHLPMHILDYIVEHNNHSIH